MPFEQAQQTLAEHASTPPSAARPNPEAAAEADARTGLCPLGHGIMRRAKVELSEPFFLERCASCGGIWFDEGELGRLANSSLLMHLFDLWSSDWQLRQRKAKAAQAQAQRLRSLLDPPAQEALVRASALLAEHPEPAQVIARFERSGHRAALEQKLGEDLFSQVLELSRSLAQHPAGAEAARFLLEEVRSEPLELKLQKALETLFSGAPSELVEELKATLRAPGRAR